MRTLAIVKEVHGTRAVVETERLSACEGCHKKEDGGSCSVCSLMGANRKLSATAENSLGAEPGDVVEVETAASRVLFYALLVFVLPIAVTLAAYGVSTLFTDRAAWQIACALIGFFGTFFCLFGYSAWVRKKRCDVVIIKIQTKGDALRKNVDNPQN